METVQKLVDDKTDNNRYKNIANNRKLAEPITYAKTTFRFRKVI